jgi:hypothetical protein
MERNDLMRCGYSDIGCMPFVAYKLTKLIGSDSSLHSERKAALTELFHQSGVRDVPLAILPKFVHFGDINDPHTLAQVSPYDLAVSFGPGVTLKRVFLQLTDDPITPPSETWPLWMKVRRQNVEFRGYESS